LVKFYMKLPPMLRYVLVIGSIIFLVTTQIAVGSAHAVTSTPVPPTSTLALPTPTPVLTIPSPDQRFGIVVHTTLDTEYFLDQLAVNWFLHYRTEMTNIPNSARKPAYIQLPSDKQLVLLFDNLALLDDSVHVVQRLDVHSRVAIDYQHVGGLAFLKSANLIK